MHQAGYVHRDIKCENLLLADTTRHQLILADFGFAAAYRPGHRTLTETWGSVHYSSPEICARIPYVVRR
jgi:serine/threonine protein kinase